MKFRVKSIYSFLSKSLLFPVLMVLLIGQASAGQYSINGTTYDTTWDGRVIPSSQIVYGSNDDVILVQEMTPATSFTVGNDSIYINNNFTSFKREKFKISPVLTYSKSLLLSKMVSVNVTTGYLVFPYQLSRIKDFISDNEIRMGNWTFRAGAEHIDIYDDNQTTINGTQNILPKSAYTFLIVNDDIRLYFLKSEVNKLQGNITFEMNSWTINGSTTPGWQTTSYDNVTADDITVKVGTNDDYFEDGLVSDYTGTNININSTVVKTGTYSAKLNGTTDGVYVKKTIENITSNFSTSFDVYLSGFGAELDQRYIMLENGGGVANSIQLDVHRNATDLNFRYNDGSYKIIQTASTETWYNFKVDVYPGVSDSTFNLYIDNNQVLTNANTRGTVNYFNNFSLSQFNAENSDIIYIDNIRIWNTTSGNLTAWYDSGSGNEVYKIDVNATTPENTNYSVNLYNNVTDAFIETLGTGLSGNQSLTITNPLQDAKINVTLNGNQTATPELVQVTFFDKAAGGEASEATFTKAIFMWWD